MITWGTGRWGERAESVTRYWDHKELLCTGVCLCLCVCLLCVYLVETSKPDIKSLNIHVFTSAIHSKAQLLSCEKRHKLRHPKYFSIEFDFPKLIFSCSIDKSISFYLHLHRHLLCLYTRNLFAFFHKPFITQTHRFRLTDKWG